MKDRHDKHILLDVTDGVAQLTFNLPQYGNALDYKAVQEALDTLLYLEGQQDVGVLVLTGAGKPFCTGFNLKEIPAVDDLDAIREHFRVLALWWHQLLARLTRMPMPVLAAVNGVAAGSGLGMVLCSDMAVCTESASFLCAWHGIGIANDATTSYSLTRIVGFRRALEMMLTNRSLEAEEALEWNLVNRVYPDSEFRDRVDAIARDLAAAPTHLQAMAKESFHQGWRQSIEEAAEHEIRNVLRSLDHPHFLRALQSFLDKKNRSDRVQVRLP